MKFSPLSCYLIPLRPKYSPQHPTIYYISLWMNTSHETSLFYIWEYLSTQRIQYDDQARQQEQSFENYNWFNLKLTEVPDNGARHLIRHFCTNEMDITHNAWEPSNTPQLSWPTAVSSHSVTMYISSRC
jgi:hypothetical protein